MARNKYPEKTVEKILTVARDLFFQKGYDQTTMQDIIDQGLSKGAIYHHFKSKKEIFDRMMVNLEQTVVPEMNQSQNACEQLKQLLGQRLIDTTKINLLKKAQSLFEDPKVFGELYFLNMQQTTQQVQQFIVAGNQDGSMHCEFPQETAELVVQFFSIWIGTGLYTVTQTQFERKVRYYQNLFHYFGVELLDEHLMDELNQYYQKFTAV